MIALNRLPVSTLEDNRVIWSTVVKDNRGGVPATDRTELGEPIGTINAVNNNYSDGDEAAGCLSAPPSSWFQPIIEPNKFD